MSNKLICPFCQQELDYLAEDIYGGMYCPNCKKHDLFGNEKMWQALIQAKQDLVIATKALEEIDTTRCIPQQTLISLGKFSKTTRFNAGNIICVATPDYIHNTLEQIEHKDEK